jgi:hypothetical protein
VPVLYVRVSRYGRGQQLFLRVVVGEIFDASFLTLSSKAYFIQKKISLLDAIIYKSRKNIKLELTHITIVKFLYLFLFTSHFSWKSCFLNFQLNLKANLRCRSYMTYALLKRLIVHKLWRTLTAGTLQPISNKFSTS